MARGLYLWLSELWEHGCEWGGLDGWVELLGPD